MKHFKTIDELSKQFNVNAKHPLVDIQRFADTRAFPSVKYEPATYEFYTISFISNFDGFMRQGDTKFDGTNGVLYFITPGQTYACTAKTPWEGYQLLIHPDIFKDYLTEKDINAYSFFSYNVDESLLLTAEEEQAVESLMEAAWHELHHKNDAFSIPIILSFTSILLNMSERFYRRQFETRSGMCDPLTARFFGLLKTYYADTPQPIRQPTVAFFSEKLAITPNYLSDMIRHHTGKSALAIIHEHIIEEAMKLLKTTNLSVSEISMMLGFEYPTYFSRLFKKKTAVSPSTFRKSVKSI